MYNLLSFNVKEIFPLRFTTEPKGPVIFKKSLPQIKVTFAGIEIESI
jgi:hypothetical protein